MDEGGIKIGTGEALIKQARVVGWAHECQPDDFIAAAEQLLKDKACEYAAEQIATWLEVHGDDEEFRYDGGMPSGYYASDYASPAKLAAAIREGRWRK